MQKSEHFILIKRSLFWLVVMVVVVCGTCYLQGNIYDDNFDFLPASTTTREIPIYCVDTDKKQVALSFDAAWGNEDTGKILGILAEYEIKATFFMTGGWVDNYPDDVKAIYEAGHDLGNHSQNHKHMSSLNSSEIAEELNCVGRNVESITGYKMDLFRPPYGDYNNTLISCARSCGYYTIQWDVDSLDWKNYGVESIINTVLNHKDLKNGSIILMHNGATYTAQALPKVIEGLQEKGYEIVPISSLIYRKNYHIGHDGSQICDEEVTTNTQ